MDEEKKDVFHGWAKENYPEVHARMDKFKIRPTIYGRKMDIQRTLEA